MSNSDEHTFAHVRGRDRELLGWITMTADEQFAACDLLWRPVGTPGELTDAEHALDELGLRYLAEPWLLTTDDGPIAVQIVEITADTVTVAPLLESENVAKALDLTQRTTLPNPTDQLQQVSPAQ